MRYPFSRIALPYDYSDLEPYIDTETMHYHYDKHYKTYVNNLNKALEKYPGLQKFTLEQLLAMPRMDPAILKNGGGAYNHGLYFSGMAPAGRANGPQGQLLYLIERGYGSFEGFKKVFNRVALNVFGSGYAVLAVTAGGRLSIVPLKNQDTLRGRGLTPLVCVDVWEHAYYLKYKNQRAAYLENIWNVIDFPIL